MTSPFLSNALHALLGDGASTEAQERSCRGTQGTVAGTAAGVIGNGPTLFPSPKDTVLGSRLGKAVPAARMVPSFPRIKEDRSRLCRRD